MPSMAKTKGYENNYVLNYIKTKRKINDCPNRIIAVGGFTHISVSEIEFWYISSSNITPENFEEEINNIKPIKKLVVLKTSDKKQLKVGAKNRVAH